jgi:hypothetical protein
MEATILLGIGLIAVGALAKDLIESKLKKAKVPVRKRS